MSANCIRSFASVKLPLRIVKQYEPLNCFCSVSKLQSQCSLFWSQSHASYWHGSQSYNSHGSKSQISQRNFSWEKLESNDGNKASDGTSAKEPTDTETVDENNIISGRRRILVDPSTVKQVYYFDTLTLVKNLEKHGFSREQAEGVTEGFVEIIHSTIDYQTRNMVTKPQQEIMVQQLLAEIVGIKRDMVILQKSDFTALQHDTEKQRLELRMLHDSIEDEIQKIKGQVTLDINLERGRAIEAHADGEKEVNKLHSKIDTGMANLRTMFEQYRNDVFKYAGGTVLTCASISLGLLRLWS